MIINQELMNFALKGREESKKKEEEIPKNMTAEQYHERKRKRFQERNIWYDMPLNSDIGIWNPKNDMLNYI
jgi:hypothetical protein